MDNNNIEKTKKRDNVDNANPDVKPMEKIVKAKRKIKIKSWIILLLINTTIFFACLFFIITLPQKAVELNRLKSEEQKVKESKNVDISGLEYKPTKDKVDKLIGYYPEEAGLIKFIENMEVLKERGFIKNFSLVGQDAVKDKTGAFGIPFIVEFEDSWEKINVALQEFQKLPYLIRAINIEARVLDEEKNNFKYGGFLYVSDKLAKTR